LMPLPRNSVLTWLSSTALELDYFEVLMNKICVKLIWIQTFEFGSGVKVEIGTERLKALVDLQNLRIDTCSWRKSCYDHLYSLKPDTCLKNMLVGCLGELTEPWGVRYSNGKMSKTPTLGTTTAILIYRERIPWWCPKKVASQGLEKKARRRHFSVLCRFYVRNGGQTITVAKQKRTISASCTAVSNFSIGGFFAG
jgi:hypothetical protein